MSANRPHIPRLTRHKATGQAVVRLNGRDFYLGRYGSAAAKAAYERLIAEWLANGKQLRGTTQGLNINELALAYWRFALTYYVKDGQPSGHLSLVKSALRYLRRHYGTLPVHEFGPLSLQGLLQKLVEAKLSRGYINGHLSRIKLAFKWAVSRELIPVTVYQAIATVPGLKCGRTAAREPAPIRPVSPETIDATLPQLPPVVADMVRLHRLMGCRPGELCRMRPCDVDTRDDVWWYMPESHKTEHHGRARQIALGPKAQDILRPYLVRDPNSYCFSPAESEQRRYELMRSRRKTRVQPSQIDRRKSKSKRRPGDRYTTGSYYKSIQRACKEANALVHHDPDSPPEKRGVQRWHSNQIRHLVATEVRQQFGLEGAQVILGHARADVTQIYAERDMNRAAAVARKVG